MNRKKLSNYMLGGSICGVVVVMLLVVVVVALLLSTTKTTTTAITTTTTITTATFTKALLQLIQLPPLQMLSPPPPLPPPSYIPSSLSPILYMSLPILRHLTPIPQSRAVCLTATQTLTNLTNSLLFLILTISILLIGTQ